MSENVYNAEISRGYDATMDAGYNPNSYKVAVEAMLKILGSRKKVLELGIGTGLLAEQLVECGIDLSGTDFSASMLEKAAARLGDRVKLYQQDVLTLDLPEVYEAAVSHGGVWVAVRDGNFLDSHITGYERNLQGLTRVAQHLTPDGVLIINVGPEQKDLTLKLTRGEYSQRVFFKGDHYEKDYVVTEGGWVVALQHCVYGRFNEEETARMMEEAGFKASGRDEHFAVFEKGQDDETR
ncbi:class I SAM-dependent methyltransferase [Candidatus Woesearchaeota archaeon]|nr:class I SAM-dependent methyltransferase [Candidatus Woesearchaeota archaeon]